MTGDILLKFDNVAVGYDRHVVLSDLQLALPQGGFIGLLGANGSGKSTLIKTILGILPPLGGRLEFPSHQGRAPVLGYVPQRESLDSIFPLSSFEVVLMGVCGRVGPGLRIGAEEKNFARQCLHAAGAENLSRQPFAQLSGGQKQRVLIARALAAQPEFLLLDEPTAGIDAVASLAVMELLSRIHREQGLTILLVNHDLRVMQKYANHVLWLHEGRVLEGTAHELLNRDKIAEILGWQLH